MKKMIPLIIVLCLVTSLLAQGEISTISTNPPLYDVQHLSFTNGNPGYYSFGYKVRGENIAHVKRDSLVITKLQAKDGTTIPVSLFDRKNLMRGLDNTYTTEYRLNNICTTLDDIHAQEGLTYYAVFFVEVAHHDKISLSEVPMIEGFVTLYVGEEKETKTLTAKKTDDWQTHDIEGARSIRSVSTRYERDKGFRVALSGLLEDPVASLDIVVNGQRLRHRDLGMMSFNARQFLMDAYFDIPESTEEITVNLTLWKNLKEQAVSFGKEE